MSARAASPAMSKNSKRAAGRVTTPSARALDGEWVRIRSRRFGTSSGTSRSVRRTIGVERRPSAPCPSCALTEAQPPCVVLVWFARWHSKVGVADSRTFPDGAPIPEGVGRSVATIVPRVACDAVPIPIRFGALDPRYVYAAADCNDLKWSDQRPGARRSNPGSAKDFERPFALLLVPPPMNVAGRLQVRPGRRDRRRATRVSDH
jgi:hypothetical protein